MNQQLQILLANSTFVRMFYLVEAQKMVVIPH